METLAEFIARAKKQANNYGGNANTRGWVEEPDFEALYIRYGSRLVPDEGRKRDVLDLANMSTASGRSIQRRLSTLSLCWTNGSSTSCFGWGLNPYPNTWGRASSCCPGKTIMQLNELEMSYLKLPNNKAKVACTCGWESEVFERGPFDPSEALVAYQYEHFLEKSHEQRAAAETT